MQKDNKFFDDMAKLASGAASNVMGLGQEIEEFIVQKVEKILKKNNFSTKEEVDTMIAMLAKVREEQENIKSRLEKLENSKS